MTGSVDYASDMVSLNLFPPNRLRDTSQQHPSAIGTMVETMRDCIMLHDWCSMGIISSNTA